MTPPTEPKPVKEKKPRSEAQIAATQKALAAMSARRKEINEKAKEKKEEVKKAKKVVEDKILKEDIGFVMKNDFESLRKELYELKAAMKPQVVEKIVERPVPAKPERIIERVIERVPTQPAQPTKLSGHALLDRIFFEK